MYRALLLSSIVALTGCEPADGAWVDPDPLPAFVDDCSEALNDELATASGVPAQEQLELRAEICSGDVDIYRVDIPPGQWLQVTVIIDGTGKDATDLDLYDVEHPERPIDPGVDFINEEIGGLNVIGYSATTQPFERLAWHNAGTERISRWLMVHGYEGAQAGYTLEVRTSELHEGLDCDAFYDDSPAEGGPCNRILQFPQANALDEGYLASHEAHYSSLRREVIYLVRHAARATSAAFPDTNPLGLLDMSQWDGDTPGRMRGQLRHPEGTHVRGNDIDIAYYQTGANNLGRTVCPDDGYFCTGDPNILDARRTAYFMAQLFESEHVRVIGVDPRIATKLIAAAEDLYAEGLIERAQKAGFTSHMAYGEGWPFHQHHMHFSWDWESGYEGRSSHPEGCQLAPGEPSRGPSGKRRAHPGR